MVKNLTISEFNKLFTMNENVLNNNENKDSILKFTAKWCGPCKMLAPILTKISEKYQDISVYEIDVDEEFDLSLGFNIRSVPTMIFVSENGKTNQQIGALTEGQIEKLINKYFKSGE